MHMDASSDAGSEIDKQAGMSPLLGESKAQDYGQCKGHRIM